jgi:hypothetical protein
MIIIDVIEEENNIKFIINVLLLIRNIVRLRELIIKIVLIQYLV